MADKSVILYMTDDSITAFECERKAIVAKTPFHRDGKGIIQFSTFIAKHKEMPFLFLLNTVEEEYKLDTMPYVEKKQSMLLQRHLLKKYRENQFKFGVIQGREHFGKKEAKILLAAIGNDACLSSWLQPLLENKVSISGIYSLPMCTENIANILDNITEKLLVVSFDSCGLRLTYLDEGNFKISRLIKIETTDTTKIVQEINAEIEKTLKYLGRIRLVFADQKPDVLFIANRNICEIIKLSKESETNTSQWFFCDEAYIAQKLGINIEESVVTELFVHTLLNTKVTNHYANQSHTRYYRTRRLRRPIEISSAAFLLVMTLISGVIFIDSQVLDVKLGQLLQKVNVTNAKLAASQASLPDYPVKADALKSGVEAIDTLIKEKPKLKQSLLALSRTLSAFPNIELEYLQWSIAERNVQQESNESEPEVYASDDPTEMADVDVNSETEKRWVQVINIQGKLSKFDGNYTLANKSVDELIKKIEKNKAFYSAYATKKPVSHKPEEKINGTTGNQQKHNEVAEFSLEIVINESELS